MQSSELREEIAAISVLTLSSVVTSTYPMGPVNDHTHSAAEAHDRLVALRYPWGFGGFLRLQSFGKLPTQHRNQQTGN